MNTRKQRVITGLLIMVVYVAIVVLTLYVHPIFFDIFVFLLAACGAYEVAKALKNVTSPAIIVLDMIGIVLGFAAFWFAQYYFGQYSVGLAAYFVSLFVMIIVTVIVTAASKTYVKGNAISTIFVMLYPCAVLMLSMGLNYFISGKIDIGITGSQPQRNAGIALLFVIPTFTDMLAYAVGSRLKGKKLCPSISPNKTISGAIGGLFGGMLASGFIMLLMFLAEHFGINLFGLSKITDSWTTTIINMLVIGLVGSVFDQGGDLIASYIKRKTNIKDFSNLLPGHGGIIDRVDGFMFCGVFLYLYFAVMVLI